ncbi:unnamed protein product (macronuclear) [Paramecium tetraurelia]|uniref:Uncharacterized protein n=1 Tax=Paramecium tetraurelia TaxID=5888 RepID=A0BI33_PARTE|nr:uncharacterized protein GSPATT00029236001 [Paramecium tetraurelia]CAK58200.1 unnamed protein product [Paramecium tetraurelia]|eukprot:XP_001425598.1 hypothetical protein (macronuclear) [Paramecium tetraurelia strain d4-2]
MMKGQMSISIQNSLQLMIYAIKGNHVCKEQRKSFNLCRLTPLGKYVEAEFCKDNAVALVDCFLKVQYIAFTQLCRQRNGKFNQ